jgi:hypothetical protein
MLGKKDLSHIAGYLFVVGLIAAVIGGIAVTAWIGPGTNAAAWISVMFVVLGVVIGALMTTSKKIEEEIYVLLLATLALLVASNMGVFGNFDVAGANLGTALNAIVAYVAMFSAAAIIVLAVRTITRFHVSKI